MKLLRQMYRRPVKPVLNGLLVALATLVFITSIGQYVSTALTRMHLDDSYSTIAVRSAWGRKVGSTTSQDWPQETQELKQELLENHPDMVLGESYSGLYSVYVPELQFDNFSNHEFGSLQGDGISGNNQGYPYRDAMLVVRLEKIGTVEDSDAVYVMDGTGTETILEISKSIMCSAVIEQVVGLADSYASPVGQNITLTIYTANGSQAPDLVAGERYIVYGRDYLNMNGPEQERLRRTEQAAELYGVMQETYWGDSEGYFAAMNQVGAMLTVRDQSAEPISYRGENGFELRWDLQKNYVFKDGKLTMGFTDAAAYAENYQIPTIAPLNGTVEEFLNSEDGQLWKQALEEMEIHNHSFPVMGVEKLGYQESFARGDAHIVAGREFTQEEIAEKQKVCIVSDAIAEINGLQVGDQISMQVVAQDPNLWNTTDNNVSWNTSYPSAAYYSRAEGFETELESFTIVGIYHYNNAWQTNYYFEEHMNDYRREGSVSSFGYTTNTIFVPQNALDAESITHEDGIFHSLVLKNGTMEQFNAYMEELGYETIFFSLDGGYSQIVADLDAYEGVARKAMLVGILSGVVLLVLFVALQPLQNKNNVYLLGSLGATRLQRIGYFCANGCVPLVIGTAAGAVLGSLLWEKVANSLMKSVEVSIPLEQELEWIGIAVAGAQLLLTLVAITLVGVACSGSRNLMKRK